MPKSKKQNELIKLERYNAIIDACITLFAFRPYMTVSVDDIARSSICSHGLFYHYFNNKEDAFHKMMERVINDIETWLSPIDLEYQPARNSLMDLTTLINQELEGHNDIFVFSIYLLLNIHFKTAIPEPPKHEEPKSLKRQPLFKIVSHVIQKGQKEGTFLDEDVKKLTVAFLSMIKGLFYNRAVLGSEKFICPTPEIMAHLLLKN